MDAAKVRRFWSWFVEGRTALERNERGRIDELDRKVRELDSRLSWEIGPGVRLPNMLAISPAGDRHLLDLTEAIVAVAPSVAGWEFHSAKPPKQWKDQTREFEYDGIVIDATDWKYGLIAINEAVFFDIVWLAPNLETLRGVDSNAFGDLLLESEVGEREKILRFDQVEVAPLASSDPGFPVSPISVLREHLAKLTRA